jgi:hypothetical protein
LQKQQDEVFAAKLSETEESIPEPEQEAELVIAETSNAPARQMIPLATSLETICRRTSRRGGVLEGQLTLF